MQRLALLLALLLAMPCFGQDIPEVYNINHATCTVTPTITGDTVGDTLTASSTWTDTIEIGNEWYVNDVLTATTASFDTSALQAGDVVYVRQAGLNAAGVVYAYSTPVTLIGAGNSTVESATINSAGDTLTVVLSVNDTITDATGFSLTFDNQAERTLTYSSGSGTDTIVFAISANPDYTSAGTDNDAAPAGTDCTFSYDADIGNVGILEDVGGFTVTNNSTAHPEPDLPGNLPDTTLPTGWDGVADHTPADMAALNELTDGDGSGDVQPGDIVELSGTYTGRWTFATNIDGTTEAPIIFRTSGYSGLPAYGTRIADDEDSLATVTYAAAYATDFPLLDMQKGSGTHGASNLRFIGIKFIMTWPGVPNDIPNIINLGQDGNRTDTSEVPDGIGFNHCWITCDDDTEVREALRMDAINSFFVDGRITNMHAGSTDGSTGMRTYLSRGLVFHNNYVEAESAAAFLGDNNTGRCEDVVISDNQMTRPTDWPHIFQKSPGVEAKTGLRVWIKNNCIENGTWGPDAFGAITIKAGEPTVPVVDKYTRHVTAEYNDIYNCRLGFSLNERGSGGTGQGPCMDILVENNTVRGSLSSFAAIINPGGTDDGTFDRIIIRHNSFDKQVFSSGTTPARYLIFDSNILAAYGANNLGYGAVALNAIWGSTYDFQYNAFTDAVLSQYDGYGTQLGVIDNNVNFGNNSSTLGYSTYPPTTLADLAITGGVCNNAGSDGSDIGADIAGLITIMSGVKE